MPSDVTRILEAIDEGDPRASEALLPMVYDELRMLADSRLARERPGQTLNATALVHEAYLRLIGPAESPGDSPDEGEVAWDGRGHFFAAAAEAMRRILIDRARARGAAKRSGSWRKIDVDLTRLSLDEVPPELVDLDESLSRFRREEPEKARLVELRFFAGLTMEQAAAVMGLSLATAGRHWAFARAWLYKDLNRNVENPPEG
jgi:RNA polymerase sigma factor (TIGR02999 family)